MTIALVGFTNSYNDNQWLEMGRAWIASQDSALALAWPSAVRRVFDLRGPGAANFLDDAGEFDVVILFAIFNPTIDSAEFRRSLGRQCGQTSLAANHSRENWRNRLARTNAKYLLVFRRDDSIDGDWLEDIEGYERHAERPGVFGLSIYSKRRP